MSEEASSVIADLSGGETVVEAAAGLASEAVEASQDTDASAEVSSSEESSDVEAKAEEPASQEEIEAKAAEEAKAKEEQIKADRIRKILAREKSLLETKAKADREIQAARKELEDNYNAIKQQYEAVQREQHTIATQKAQIEQVVNELRKDPVRFLQARLGMTPEQVMDRFVNEGKPSKDEVYNEEISRTKAEIQELRQWKQQFEQQVRAEQEAYKQQQEQSRRQAAEAQAAAERQATENAFLNVASDENKYPYLAAYDKATVIEQARQMVAYLGPDADTMSIEDLAGLMEQNLVQHYSTFKPKLPKPAAATQQQQTETKAVTATTPESAKPVTTRVNQPNTLSNDLVRRNSVKTASNSIQEEKLKLIRELEAADPRSNNQPF